MNKSTMKIIAVLIVMILAISAIGAFLVLYKPTDEEDEGIDIPEGVKVIEKEYNFSYPVIADSEREDFLNIYVEESDYNSIHDQWPVLPVNYTTFELPFGSKIIDFQIDYSEPEDIVLSKKINYGSCSAITEESEEIYNSNEMYPSNFISYQTGAGLSDNEQKTFITVRINPVTYTPMENLAHFLDKISFKIIYEEPGSPLLDDIDIYDLLIIAPNRFANGLQQLIEHKEKHNIKTNLITTEEIYGNYEGRDEPEQIKYCIKESIENYGIKDVLLVGGRDRQTQSWTLPVRYSHVLIREGTQESIEPEFLSDLYFADIYDSEGNFSCWDTNNNDVFAEYDGKTIDEMDLYPDVRLGRLPVRNKLQLRTVVNKIINYETSGSDDWFKNIILVAGDHWPDDNNVAEGILIMEEASSIMSDFNPVKLYVNEKGDLTIRDVNKAFNKGAGFAYFSGHGSKSAWGAPLPPDSTGWNPKIFRWLPDNLALTGLYRNRHMNYLRNKFKLPVTVVGGCFNGKFDVTLDDGALYCWAWKLTSKRGGGAIATIANTGLGTHALDDSDSNGVNDYLEVLDGWLELRFFELYQYENMDRAGQNHQEAITQYLHRFLGEDDSMDIKMVQQWQLFGDPTLKIGGY